jgi:hypothetical protein
VSAPSPTARWRGERRDEHVAKAKNMRKEKKKPKQKKT